MTNSQFEAMMREIRAMRAAVESMRAPAPGAVVQDNMTAFAVSESIKADGVLPVQPPRRGKSKR